MPKSSTLRSYRTSRRWTEEDARGALSALAESKLSVAAFAARERLDIQRFYVWRRQLARTEALVAATVATAPAFVEIRGIGSEREEVVLRSGVVLCVADSGFPE